MITDQQKDEILWKIAKARVAFRWSFIMYLAVNTFLIVIWFFTSEWGSYFWPIWPIMGWGLGMAFQFFHAFHGNKIINTEKEFEKLKKEQQN